MKEKLSFSQKVNIAITRIVRNSTEKLLWRLTEMKNFFSKKKPHTIGVTKDNILICGNGPSVNRINLQYYKESGYEIMCVNFYAIKSKQFDTIRPKYYCCIDPGFYCNSSTTEVNLKVEELFKKLNTITWRIFFICAEGQNPPITNDNIEIIKLNVNRYYANNPLLTKGMMKKFAKNRAFYSYDNVLLACLYYAITAKANKIALTGFETNTHNEFFVNKKNETFRKMNHFYGDEIVPVNTYSPFGSSQMLIWFHSFYSVFLGCNILKNYAKYQNVQIINLTEDSFLDMFDKLSPVESL